MSHNDSRVKKEEGAVQTTEGEAPEISLHAIVGSLSPRTMRVMGKVKWQSVVIFVDSDSTYNFLDDTIIPKAQLNPKIDEQMQVRVANGELVTSAGKLEGAKILLQE